jgi:hypothetical protein
MKEETLLRNISSAQLELNSRSVEVEVAASQVAKHEQELRVVQASIAEAEPKLRDLEGKLSPRHSKVLEFIALNPCSLVQH